MRRVLAAFTIVLLILIVGFVRIQRAGTARLIRRGDSVAVLNGRLGWAARFIGQECDVPLQGDRLYFVAPLRVTTHGGEDLDVRVSFTYDPPEVIPRDWPPGDWCQSLSRRVEKRLGGSLSTSSYEIVAAAPRRVSTVVTEELAGALDRDGLRLSNVAARFELGRPVQRVEVVPDVVRLARRANPVIFIGLDGADWQLLDVYIARGIMPNLASLVWDGSGGTLTTEHPPLSPLLWDTMMTGVSPLEHQILDFTHFNPISGNKEPITSDERKTPAIWNMATWGGKRVAVFGLWATYPAEPVHGIVVSDRLFTFLFSESAPPPGVVFPPTRERWVHDGLRSAENAVDFQRLRTYLPWLDEAQYRDIAQATDPYSKPASALRRILVETDVYQTLSTKLLSMTVPDLTIVYLQGTDTIGHVFAPFSPPKQPQVSDQDYERYHQVPELYFRHIDEILGSYVRLARASNAVVMLASDHGFHWIEDRPTELSSFAAATAAKWHRSEGIYLVSGPGIVAAPGHTGHGTIRQVCATLLALAGLPSGRGLAGPPLDGVRQPTQSIDYRNYFHPLSPESPTARLESSSEAIAKLRALGYIGGGESVAPRPTSETSTKTAGAYNNQGLILKHEGRIPEAVAAFDKAMAIDPNLASAKWNLSDLLFDRHEQLDRADELLASALADGLPDAPKYVIERAIKYHRGGDPGRSLRLLESAVAAQPQNATLHIFRGRYRVELKNCAGALEDFRAAQEIKPDDPVAFASAGLASLCLGNQSDAKMYFRKSLALDPNQPMLRKYLGP